MSWFICADCAGMPASCTPSSATAAIGASRILRVIRMGILLWSLSGKGVQSFNVLSRNAFAMTDTDDRLIAAAASIGDSNVPVRG